MWQMGSAPFIGGGFGHFYKYEPIKIEYAINRYSMETRRLLDVLDKHLCNNEYMIDTHYSIADMEIMPWVRAITTSYNASEFLRLHEYQHVNRWLEHLLARDAVARGLKVNGMGDDDIIERHCASDFDTPNHMRF